MDKYSIQSGEDLLTNRLEWKVRKLIKTNDIDQGDQYCKTIYTPGGFVWCDRPFYLVKGSQEK